MFSQLLGLGKVQNVKSFGSESLTSPALSCVTVKSFLLWILWRKAETVFACFTSPAMQRYSFLDD